MGISTQYEYSQFTNQIDLTQLQVYQLGQEVSTGKQINQMSDNPFAASQVLDLNQVQSTLTQYDSNIQTATSFVNQSASALGTTQTLVQQAYTLALQGANATQDANSLNGIVTQINQIQQRILALGNTQGSNGQYLFGGQVTNTAPFTATTSGNITYNGDSNSISVDAGPALSIKINTVGSGLFDTAYNQLTQLKSDLLSGNPSTISNVDVAGLQKTMGLFEQAQGQAGAVGQTLSGATTANTQRSTELTTSISNLQDANMAQVVSQYSAAQAAYQAALMITSNASKFSLLTYL